MRRLTLALLCATYLCLSLIVALSLWRNGGGWSASIAALVGGLGLCFAFHALIEHALEIGSVRAELAQSREANKIMLEQMERLDERVNLVVQTVVKDERNTKALSGEIQMLEDLVRRMRGSLEEPTPEPVFVHRAARPDARQSGALLETVRDALTDNRVDLFLQPIVSLPQRRTVYYESFSRLRDATGRVMMPAEFLSVAEPGGLVTAIDNLLLFRCVQIVRRLAKQDRKVGIFCNISMASLGDETFFPQLLDLLTTNRDLAGALIFEIGQAAYDARGAAEARNMGKLAELGYRFSLDKVTDLDIDLQDLVRADVKFIKIAAQVLQDQKMEVAGRLVFRAVPDFAAEDFAALHRRHGIEVITEKMETERQAVEVLELDIALGQGHLFGEPRAIKDSVVSEAPPIAIPRTAPPRRQAGGWI
jgi:cyclic-di-GMP phosphodiesterase, flagellum assembly factor TipF